MTGPVLAFDAAATRGARLSRVPKDRSGRAGNARSVDAPTGDTAGTGGKTYQSDTSSGSNLQETKARRADIESVPVSTGAASGRPTPPNGNSQPAKVIRTGQRRSHPSNASATQEANSTDHRAMPSQRGRGPHISLSLQRAEVAAIYARLLGQSLTAQDILDSRPPDPVGGLSPDAIVAAFEAVGLCAQARVVLPPRPEHWPALARLTSDKLVLVLEQRGERVTIHDPDAPDHREDVSLREFTEHFTGRIIRAEPTLDTLTARHGDAPRRGHWFWSEIASFRRVVGEVAVASLVANLLAVAVALFALQVYDRVIPHQSLATLWVLTIGAGLAILFEAALRIARARLMDNAGQQIEVRLQDLLMSRVLGARATQNASPSRTFAAMRDFSSVRDFFTAATVGALTDLPFVLLFLALVAWIAGPVVWLLVTGAVVMILPSLLLQRRMLALTRATQGASIRSGRLLHEITSDLTTIKTQRAETRFARIWSELCGLTALSASEQRRLSTGLIAWAQGVQQATYVATVVMGSYLVFSGAFTVGTIIATGILTGRTLGPLTGLAGLIARWSKTRAALDALDEIADAPQEEQDDRQYLRRDRLAGDFAIRDLVHCFEPDGIRALDLKALDIPAGQTVALLGANGSGKTTCLELLSGLHSPTSGRVMIDGADIGQISPRDLRRTIGYFGQDVRLFAGTLRENLVLSGMEPSDDRLMAALEFAGLGAFVRSHPRGLDLIVRDGGTGLSAGQRQSIGWARLWLQDPAICLLDEPTSALDQTLEADLVGRLSEWLQGRTAVIATHRLAMLELADRTIVLHSGRLAVDGPRAQVLAHLTGKAS